LERKSKAELFFDQAGRVDNQKTDDSEIIGWYGNSAIEAMANGIPTISHLSSSALQQAKNAGKDVEAQCPIINTGLDEASMKNSVLGYLGMSSAEKLDLSQKTRSWVETFHAKEVVGKELIGIYKSSLKT